MTEKKFIVRMIQYWEYEVTAETADDAKQMVNDGEQLGEGSCGGYGIDSVVSADKAGQYWSDEDDERAKCLACGHLFYDGHTGARHRDPKTLKTVRPNACDEHGCDCLDAVKPLSVLAVGGAR